MARETDDYYKRGVFSIRRRCLLRLVAATRDGAMLKSLGIEWELR